ncbi:MAG: RNA polymerase sigma factor [Spirochaetes bacterium]|nr:RNA polymerase sigma factor [Spirochaetota bacterium]
MRQNPFHTGPGSLDSPEEIRSLSGNEILDRIYHVYGDYIYTIVRTKMESAGFSEDDTNDCFGHVIMKLAEHNCKKVRQFRGRSSFKTYLTVLCGNTAIDYMRTEIRKKRLTTTIDDTDRLRGLSSEACGPDLLAGDPALQLVRNEEEALVTEAAALISRAVGRLDHREQCVFRLRIEDGRSFREINETLGIDNSKYLFSKILNTIRSSIDTPVRRKIEELLEETHHGN